MVRFNKFAFLVAFLGLMVPVVAVAQTETVDEVYKKALKEEGRAQLLLLPRTDQRGDNLPVVREAFSGHQDQPCGCHLR